MPKLKQGTIIPTDKEDKVISLQAKQDNTLLTDQQLASMKPITDIPALRPLIKRGRPIKPHPKKSTTIRLDADILDFFKAQGKGWQTHINKALHEYVDSKHTT